MIDIKLYTEVWNPIDDKPAEEPTVLTPEELDEAGGGVPIVNW